MRLPNGASWSLLTNASSLFGSAAVTAMLGYVYWWVAARNFPPEAVGLASAVISGMTLLATLATGGFGTLLIGEVARDRAQASSLIATSLTVVGIASGLLGLLTVLVVPLVVPSWPRLTDDPLGLLVFVLGLCLTTMTMILDPALIGLMRGSVQFWRNLSFAVIKLVALIGCPLWLSHRSGLLILLTWVAGLVLSLVLVIAQLAHVRRRLSLGQIRWSVLRRLTRAAIAHHTLNVVLQAAPLALPIVVTAVLSARINAAFYVAWLLANGLFIASNALTTMLYAAGAGQRATLARTTRLTFRLGLAIGLVGNLVFLIGAELITTWFGPDYAEPAAAALRLMSLGMLPIVVKDHFVALCRIDHQLRPAINFALVGSSLELLLAMSGGVLGGLPGLAIGWLVALSVEAIIALPRVYRAMRSDPSPLAVDAARTGSRPAVER